MLRKLGNRKPYADGQIVYVDITLIQWHWPWVQDTLLTGFPPTKFIHNIQS